MRYPVVIYKDPDSDYGVAVPDFPDCCSAGFSLGEALDNAREAMELCLEDLLLDGSPIPFPRSLESYRSDPRYADGIWASVELDLSRLEQSMADAGDYYH